MSFQEGFSRGNEYKTLDKFIAALDRFIDGTSMVEYFDWIEIG